MKKINTIILFTLLFADFACCTIREKDRGPELTTTQDLDGWGFTKTYDYLKINETRRKIFWVGEEISIPVECCECIVGQTYTATNLTTNNSTIRLRIEKNEKLTEAEKDLYYPNGYDNRHWRDLQSCYHELVGKATEPGEYSGSVTLNELIQSHFKYANIDKYESLANEDEDQRVYNQKTYNYSFEVKSLAYSNGTTPAPNSKATIISRDVAASYNSQAEIYSYLINNTNTQQTLDNPFIDYYMTLPDDQQVGIFSIWSLPKNSCIQVIECEGNNYVFRHKYAGIRTLDAGKSLGQFQLALQDAPSNRTSDLNWFNFMKEKTKDYDANEDYSYLYPAESYDFSAARNMHYNYKMASFENNGTHLYGNYPSWLNSSCHIIQPKERVKGETSRIQYRETSQINLKLCSDNNVIIPNNTTSANLAVQFRDREPSHNRTGYFDFRIANRGTKQENLDGYQLRFFYGGTSYDPSRVKYTVRSGNPAGAWSAERCRDNMYVLKINLTSYAQINAGEYFPGDNTWGLLFEANVDNWESGIDIEKQKMFSWKNTSTFTDNENIGLFDPNGKQVYGRGDLPSCDGDNNGGDNGGDNGGGNGGDNGGGNGGDNGGDNGNDVVTNSNLKAQFFDKMLSTKEMAQLMFRISNTGTEDATVNGYEMWFYYGGKESVNVSDLNFSLWNPNLASVSTTKCSDNEYILKVKINSGVAKAGGTFPEYNDNYIGMNVQKSNGWSDIGKSSWHSWSNVTVISDNPKMTLYDEKGNYVSGEKGYKCGQSDHSSDDDEKYMQEYKYKNLTIQFQDSDGKKKTSYGDFRFQINNTGVKDYAIGNYEMRFFFESKKDQFDASEIRFTPGNVEKSDVTKEWCGDGKYFLKIKLATDAVVKANNHFPEYSPINVFTIRTPKENEGNHLEYFKTDLYSWNKTTVMADNKKMGLFDASGNLVWGYPGYKCEHPITITPGSKIDQSRFSVEEKVVLLPYTFYDDVKKEKVTVQDGVNQVSLIVKNVSNQNEAGPVYVDYYVTHPDGQNPIFCFKDNGFCPHDVSNSTSSNGITELSHPNETVRLTDNISVTRMSTGSKHVYRFTLENGLATNSPVTINFTLRDVCIECVEEVPEPGPYFSFNVAEEVCKAIAESEFEEPEECDQEWDPRKYFIWKLDDDWSAEFGATTEYKETKHVIIYSKNEEILYGIGDDGKPRFKNSGGIVAIPGIEVQEQFPNRTDAVVYSGGQLLSNGDFEEPSLTGWELKSGTAKSIRGKTIQGSRFLNLSGEFCQEIPETALKILSDSASILSFWYKGDECGTNGPNCSFDLKIGSRTLTFTATDDWQRQAIYNDKDQLNANNKSICLVTRSELSFDDMALIPNSEDQPTTYAVRLTTTQHEELETRAYDNDRDSVLVTSSKRDSMGRSRYKYLPFSLMCSDAENCNADPLTLNNPEMAKEFYKDRPDYADAKEFPYTETRWKPDQAATKDVVGAPGKAFSLDTDSKKHHIARAYSSGINLSNVNLMDYGSLASVVNAKRHCRTYAEKECNEDSDQNDDNDYNYHAARDDNPTHIWEMNLDQNGHASFIVKDGDGNVIVSGALEETGKTGKDEVIYQLATRSVNELDSRGNVLKSHPPMSCSYTEHTSQQNCVKASSYDYDSQSRIIRSSEPDAGRIITYYDLSGRVRATQTEKQIVEKKASVMLYDHLDRVIAVGEWMHNKLEDDLRTALLSDESVEANKDNFPKEEDLTPGTITRTFYDKMPTADTLEKLCVDLAPSGVTFENTKGRITATISDVRAVFNEDGSAKKASNGTDSVVRVSTANSYDKYGRVVTSFSFDPTMPVDSLKMLAVATAYDLSGKVTATAKYPYGVTPHGQGRAVFENYIYDRLGRISFINTKNGGASSAEIAHYEYYPTGAVKSITLGKSIILTYTYHISGAVKTAIITSADGSKLYSETLYYEDCGGNGCEAQYNGNISRMVHEMALNNSEVQGSRDVLYVYDQLNRLTQADDKIQNEFDEFFTYDAQGRITAQRRGDKARKDIPGGEYTYDNKTNMLKSVANGMGGTADTRKMSNPNNFMYDSEGKLIFDNSKKLQISYDWRGMPVEFTQTEKPEGSSADKLYKLVMDYDGSGRRISKTIMYKNEGASNWELSQITHYTGIGTEIRENFAGAASETKVVVNLPNGFGRYAIEDASERDNDGITGDALAGYIPNAKFEWYLKNNLGSTILVYGTEGNATSESHPVGNPLAAYDYRAFGEQVELLPPSTGKVTENFTGKELDDETKLNYFGARYLDPMLGMWTSVDPARQFASPYLYVGNGVNPVNAIDPDGNYALNLNEDNTVASMNDDGNLDMVSVFNAEGSLLGEFNAPPAESYFFSKTGDNYDIVGNKFDPDMQAKANEMLDLAFDAWPCDFPAWGTGGEADFKNAYYGKAHFTIGVLKGTIMTAEDAGNAMWGGWTNHMYLAPYWLSRAIANGVALKSSGRLEDPQSSAMQIWGYANFKP